MAKIVPYGDPNAYGKFGKNVVFRRHRGCTVLSQRGRPRNPRSAKQVQIRDKLTQNVRAYQVLTNESRKFYAARGTQVNQTSRDFFLSVAMKDLTPSKTPQIQMQTVSNMAIFKTVSGHQNGFEIAVEGWIPSSVTWDCLLWSEMGSLAEIQTPLIGPAGVIIPTVTYGPGRFGDSLQIPNATGGASWSGFPTNTLDDHGMQGFWWKPNYDSNHGTNQGLWGIDDDVVTNQIYLNWNGSAKKLQLNVVADTGGATYEFSPTFTAGQWYYINVGWDVNQPMGSRLMLNMEGTELVPSVVGDLGWTMGTPISRAWFADIQSVVNADIDNGKLYGSIAYRNQAIANRNNEAWKPQPGDPYTTYGKVVDTSNVFTHENDIPDFTIQRIRITELAGRGAEINFRYSVNIIYGLTSDPTTEALFRLPAFVLPAYGNQYFYLVDDWSAYWDLDYWKLACTDNA